jgi:ribosomal-protein-alanine N-acetyltransferase
MNIPEASRVRPMTASDVDAVLALDRASNEAPHWGRDEYLACSGTPDDSALRRIGLIAEWNELFAGFAVVRCLAVPGGNEAELESIVVAPAVRRRGIGGLLLASVIDAARKHCAGRLDLEVRASNGGAASLYEHFGFRETGRRCEYYHDPEEDAVLMSLIL